MSDPTFGLNNKKTGLMDIEILSTSFQILKGEDQNK